MHKSRRAEKQFFAQNKRTCILKSAPNAPWKKVCIFPEKISKNPLHFSENYAIILSVLSASPPDTKRISAWGISTVGSALHSHCRGQRFESAMLHHKRTLILIQRLAFFLYLKSLTSQGFFHYVGCMERAFPLCFGCKRRLMLVSPYSALPVGCMIKRLLVVEPVAVLYWVHPFSLPLSAFSRPTCSCIRIEKRNI